MVTKKVKNLVNKTNQRYVIVALFLVITVDTMGIGFVWPLFGPLFTGNNSSLFASTVSMEWRNILYGITIGIASLFAFIGAPILGNLSDYIGRRKVLLFCLIGTTVGMGISVLGIIFNQVLLLIFSRAWLGAIAASQIIAQAAIIDISSPDNKSARLGIVSAANNIGFIFGPIISSLLVNDNLVGWFNLTTPFYFAAILAILCASFLFKLYKDAENVRLPQKSFFTKIFLVFTRAFTDKHVRSAALTYICLQIGWALYLQTNFLALVQKYNYSSRSLGYFLSWLGVIFCFNLLIVVRILTRFSSLKKIIYITLPVAATCCFVAAFNNAETGIWLNILPMAASVALGSNAILTKLSNAAKATEQGWVMGVGGSLASLAWAVTPVITGVILAFSFKLPLFMASFLFLLGVFF